MGLIAFAVAIVFLALRVAAHDNDITTLIRIGESRVEGADHVPDDLAVRDGAGYDGQYFYRQALDPLSTAERVDGIVLDRPAYRSTRIGYPAVVWALSLGGNRQLVWWMMPLVNAISVGLLGWVGATFAVRHRRPAVLGLLVAAIPGMIVGLAYNLSEPLEAALVAVGLLAAARQRNVVAALALTGAMLTRESALVVPLAFLAGGLLWPLRHRLPRLSGRWEQRPSLLCGTVPIVAWIATRAVMDRRWEGVTNPLDDERSSIDHFGLVPFGDFFNEAARAITSDDLFDLLELAQAIAILWLIAAGLFAAVRDRDAGSPMQRGALLGATMLLSLVGGGGWDRMVVFLRWPDMALILALLVHLQSRAPLPRWASTPVISRVVLGLWVSVVPLWIVA